MKHVYVLIVNWNGWVDTLECLESVFSLQSPEIRVIVCDNDSQDDSVMRIVDWAGGRLDAACASHDDALRRLSSPPATKPLDCVVFDRMQAELGGDLAGDPALVLIRTGANLGFAGGNNVGLRYVMARGDYSHIWLLNNDTVADPQALAAMLRRMAEKPSAGMCGSTLLHYANPHRIQARAGGWYCKWIGLPWHLGQLQRSSAPPRLPRVERWMNYVVGASLLVSRDFLESVGLMCEDYFLYFEELDWALRGQGRFTLAYAPDSVVYHKIGRSIGTRSDPRRKSVTCDYYAIRNRLLFTRRFFPWALPSIYGSVSTALLVRLCFGQWARVRMVWRLLTRQDSGSVSP